MMPEEDTAVRGAETAVEARSLTKAYGKVTGVADVNLTIAAGEVMALVGANGAGKTTLMRTLLDLIRPTSGSITVFGHSTTRESVQARHLCSYLPGDFVIPPRLTGYQAIRRYSFTRSGMHPGRIDELAARLDVDLSRRVGDLSKGNRQKIGLVLAFAPAARLVVLDEPTSGLDPLLQRTFATLVSEAVGRGSTVLLSSHVMSEVQQIADRVILLRNGSVAVVDDVSNLLVRSRRRAQVRPAHPSDIAAIAEGLARINAVTDVRAGESLVTFAHAGSIDPVLKFVASFEVESLDLAHADLDDAFFFGQSGDAPPSAVVPTS